MRDQTFTSTRRHLLWTAGAGAVLLAGAFLLGVQAGKQSAALRQSLPADSAEPLKELPENLVNQLQPFETAQPAQAVAPKAEAPKPDDAKAPDKPADKAPTKAAGDQWTLQLVSTADPIEARKVASQAKAAGYPATIAKEKGAYKVRLSKGGDRAAMDAAAAKLAKKAGLKPFAVKAE